MKRVNPGVYTEKYYLTDCSGFEVFQKTHGNKLEPRLAELVKHIPNINNLRVLDVGCGRGEMVFWALRGGAKEVIGVDYSKAAIKLAKKALDKQPAKYRNKCKLLVMDAKKLDIKDKYFDVILLIEVLEHLYKSEQEEVFKELNRVLKPNGYLFVHTAPSRWFNDYTYKYWCYPVSTILVNLSNKITGNKYANIVEPSNIRSQSHSIMHVAEPDFFHLNRLITKTGFKGFVKSTNITVKKPEISWKDKLYNLLVYMYPLSKYFPFSVIWGNDYYLLLKKK